MVFASTIPTTTGLIIYSPLSAEKLVPSLEAAASIGVSDVICIDQNLKREQVLEISSRLLGSEGKTRVHHFSPLAGLPNLALKLSRWGQRKWGVFPAHEIAVEPAAAVARFLKQADLLAQASPHSEAAARILRVKDSFRAFIDDQLSDHPDMIAIWHRVVSVKDLSVEALREAGAPDRVVVKPRNSSGSKGVEHVDLRSPDANAQLQSIGKTLQFLRGNPNAREIDVDAVEVEAFVEGEEFAVEGFYRGGQVYVGVIHWKPNIHRDWMRTGSFMESSFVSIPPDFPGYEALVRVHTDVLSSIPGLGDTVFHAEYRLDPRTSKFFPIEIGGRIGGGSVAESSAWFSGANLYEAGIRMALGMPVVFSPGPRRLTGDGIVYPEKDGVLKRFYLELPSEAPLDVDEEAEKDIRTILNRQLKSVSRAEAARFLQNFSGEVPFDSPVRQEIQRAFLGDGTGVDVEVQSFQIWGRPGMNIVGYPGVHLGGFLMTCGEESLGLRALAEVIVGMNLCFSLFHSDVKNL